MARLKENQRGVPAQLASFGLEDTPLPRTTLPVRLPAADELQILTSAAEIAEITDAVTGSAQRLLSIFTPDLEPSLYDREAFLELVRRFVLGRSFAKVRVLVRDHSRVSFGTNRFMAMARRLSSYLEIRPLASQYRNITSAYCIADDKAIVYRLRADRWEGIAALNSPPVTRQYLAEFDTCWQASNEQTDQMRVLCS